MPPKTPATVTVAYTGGQDQVDILFPSGDTRRVVRGASIDVLPSDAAHLSPDEWSGDGVGAAFATPNPTSLEADQ